MTEGADKRLTVVTALLNIGRGGFPESLAASQQRPFDEYWAHFEQLLALDVALVIYTSPDLEDRIWRHRRPHNTRIHRLTAASLEREFPHFDTVQSIRQKADWRSQAGWLSGSPQAALAHYNPLVMSKLHMLDASAQENPFCSDFFIWLDAGIARTCAGVLSSPLWYRRLPAYLESFLLLCFPYLGGEEIHGFGRESAARWSGTDTIRWVARGGLFGGKASAIREVRSHYDSYLEATLAAGDMGTEESVLTIVAHRHPTMFTQIFLADDGLIQPFMESLVREAVEFDLRATVGPDTTVSNHRPPEPLPTAKKPACSAYILTFNSSSQLAMLLDSWCAELHAMPELRLFVVDNSTEQQCLEENARLCLHHGAIHISQGNLGICGGRQFVAEHFHDSTAANMLYLEDDMLKWSGQGFCRSGFIRQVDRLLPRALAILTAEKLDFLKLSFTEFFGSNDQQWAWHNVTPERRSAFWPAHPRRSEGLALAEIPPVRFDRLGSFGGLAFAVGEVFYSNWPQLVSRRGNQRMFLETRWQHPHEQTWMAHLYERARCGELQGGVLLASPIEHRRDFHYGAEERVES